MSTLAYSRNHYQQTPLHVATKYGSLEIVKELVKHSPDVSENMDNEGQNICHIAVMNNRVKVLK
ncbi:hypothetical protein E2562_035207 [Oryza meyeriana var. granulata]|uniref:Uncharacterized protein n=1 Tax=Oryza meyeriana var. granulata TaxID=110450 RepID=A0A6G1DRK7_9ORYZ|nr:hypothetical protein E2562_035207 [Oryza meyeriana var. granulata]